ncbi:MAG: ROK family protein [Pseudonocardiaceae bacterium]|nr:ROK family protein [Pseudonocardiaceae bacterium]
MLTVGVDVGGTSVRAGLVDAAGSVLDLRRAATPSGDDALEDAIAAVVGELAADHGWAPQRRPGQRRPGQRRPGQSRSGGVAAVGLAVAAFVATGRRQVHFSPHLSWRGAAVADRIERRVGVPVLLEHDANAAAVAEHRFGAAAGARVTTLVAIGTGIGGALLVGGELFRGAHGVAPELGHLRVVPDGRPCPCGKRGCWERYCSGTALVTTALELLVRWRGSAGPLATAATADPGRLSGRRVAAAARDGDPVARRAMQELARWLGEGLALVADIYDPQVVIIGGGVAESATLFLDEAREHYAATVTGAGYRPLARIRTSQLGDQAAIVGSALLARALIDG